MTRKVMVGDVAIGGDAPVFDIADVHHGFVGKQKEFAGDTLLIFGVELHGTSRKPLFEGCFVFQIYLVCKASLLVASCLSLFLHFGNTVVDGLESRICSSALIISLSLTGSTEPST